MKNGPFIECLECHEDVRMHELSSHIEEVHSNIRKRPVADNQLNIDDFMHGDSGFNHPTGSKQTKSSSTCSTHSVPTDLSMPGPSSVQTEEEKVLQLSEMFPACSSDELRDALTLHGTVTRAALSLSSSLTENDNSDSDILEPAFPANSDVISNSLPQILEQLQSNFCSEKEKLKVDEEDLLNDALAYYKDSTFDPKKKVRIIYRGQPAADTGGVTRQFYTQLLQLICKNFFHGDEFKSPIYNSEIVASGMMKLIGTIIVHSILQGGPGLPVFSPTVYHYLASGDIDTVVQIISINDCSVYMKHFINKVAESHDVSLLDKEETVNILSECGLTVPLTNENKMRVIQNIIIHDVIGRPKIVMDQLREGLGTMGFGAKMKQFPDLFQELFVYRDNKLTDGDVIGILKFPTAMSMGESIVKGYLVEFLQNAPQETLIQFLLFTTGSPCLPNLGLGRVEIKFQSESSIFASTCLQSLTLPPTFPDKSTFFSSMEAVLSTANKSFNCV